MKNFWLLITFGRPFPMSFRIEFKQSIIAMLRHMRHQRSLISQTNHETREYAKNLIDTTGIISYAEVTGEFKSLSIGN